MDRLGPNARLVLDVERPRLEIVPRPGWRREEPVDLHALLAVILGRFDRGAEGTELARELSHRVGNPVESIQEIVEDAEICFRGHFRHRGSASFVEDRGGEALLDRLAASGEVFRSRDVVFPGDRALFPLTVQWLVTRYCNRNCIYCYAGATPARRPGDAELSGERVREILREAVQLGAYNFFLTGGEPLLREDSYELLAYALELGMTPEVLTKQFIPQDAVDRLADAGLQQIFLSIDSLDPDVARRMTGVRTFAREISATVRRLVDAGIRVVAKGVVTTRNIDALPETVAELERLGVHWYGLDPYSPNLERHDPRLLPDEERLRRLADWVEERGREDHDLTVVFGWEPEEERRYPAPDEDFLTCHNGVTTLLFLPDGRVSRCDKPLPGTDFVVGDLSRRSVREVWSSAPMVESMKPDRELYRGTLCFDCDQFDVCHRRGRCYYDSYLTSGTLYGPHGGCPRLGRSGPALTC